MLRVEETGPFERILTLTIDPDVLEQAEKKTVRRLSHEVKIKGFRPGKAPRQMVERTVGKDTVRREAIDDALPELVAKALEDSELEPAILPSLADLRDDADGVEVDVRITLWPTLDHIPTYEGRKVIIEAPTVTDEDVAAQVERLRDQFAELEDVSREAFDGDYLLGDVRTTRDGDEVAEGSATDMLYEVGSDGFLPGMDDALRGKGAGHIAEFESVLPATMGEAGGAPVTVRVLVKGVKAKRLPELTDEWVGDVSEFDTVDEMRTELARQMREVRLNGALADLEQALLADLVADMDLELPDALVRAEMDEVLHRFVHRLESSGVGFEQYLAVTGQDESAFVADLRSQADLNLRTRILLQAVAAEEEIEVEADEMRRAVEALAAATGVEADEYRTALGEGGRGVALAGDILRRKAIDRLIELAVPVDEDGTEIEIPTPEGTSDEDVAGAGPVDDDTEGKNRPDDADDAEAPADDAAPGGEEE